MTKQQRDAIIEKIIWGNRSLWNLGSAYYTTKEYADDLMRYNKLSDDELTALLLAGKQQ